MALRERITTVRSVQRRTTRSGQGTWVPGERNTKLTLLAGIMSRIGLSPKAIEAALLEENQSPWPVI
jgi:hypothetical protein